MADLDTVAPNYRRARQRWPDAPMLCSCHDALTACFRGNAHGQVEQVKAFIESVCLTIMGEFREPVPSGTPSTTDLLVSALAALGLRNSRGASKLDKVLSAFNRLADALTEMRNDNGPVAHGKDGFLDALAADHMRAFLHAGDAILGLLLNAYEGKQPDLVATREPYERFPHFNERIDRSVAIQDVRIDDDEALPVLVVSLTTGTRDDAFEIRVKPSELLYGVDRETYRDVVLRSAAAPPPAADEEDGVAEEQIRLPESGAFEVGAPGATLAPAYSGRLAPLRAGIEGFLHSEQLDPSATGPDGAHLLDSLLATADESLGVDWKERPPLQARLKVACKRVLVRFGSSPEIAEGVAERLVAWLRVQAE